MSKFDSLINATRDFDVTIADTADKLEAAYRLRHQVYCIERGYEPDRGSVETDRFDQQAGHALLTQRSTGRVVGTVRVVSASPTTRTLDLPLGPLCQAAVTRHLPRRDTGEISRFAISKDLRDAACAESLPLRLGLMRGIVELSAQMGLTHWCAVMEPTLLRLLRASGIHFQPMGPAIEHHGLRQPCWGRIDDVLRRIRNERPAVWSYITDNGILWPETTVAVAA